jgi:hypothetical protein
VATTTLKMFPVPRQPWRRSWDDRMEVMLTAVDRRLLEIEDAEKKSRIALLIISALRSELSEIAEADCDRAVTGVK